MLYESWPDESKYVTEDTHSGQWKCVADYATVEVKGAWGSKYLKMQIQNKTRSETLIRKQTNENKMKEIKPATCKKLLINVWLRIWVSKLNPFLWNKPQDFSAITKRTVRADKLIRPLPALPRKTSGFKGVVASAVFIETPPTCASVYGQFANMAPTNLCKNVEENPEPLKAEVKGKSFPRTQSR